jgi:hypothetical protein
MQTNKQKEYYFSELLEITLLPQARKVSAHRYVGET